MMSQKLKPIPVPLKRRRQQFQTKVVPLLVFGAATWLAATLWRDAISPASLASEDTDTTELTTHQLAARDPVEKTDASQHFTRLRVQP
jgi:hypothetical protein